MSIKMTLKSPTALAIAAIAIAIPSSTFAQYPGSEEAAKMVPADAAFTSVIDSQKMSVGSQFRAKLQTKVRLQNGPELPAGTTLVGQIVSDDTQPAGATKLALRFTEADLKNGQTVPIKATIVDVFHVLPESQMSDYGVAEAPLDWKAATTIVDQIDVLSGVDLHSNIAGTNSGVFVSTKKNDIKLSPSVGVELAIAEQQGGSDSQQSISSTNGVQQPPTR